ncbi:MAG: DUF3105 domain-containing protein [Candidatus Rokubacteria bacterium]|nr:DUF3105 domain-containing protein [Candidatus Rokubacteria bacterium]
MAKSKKTSAGSRSRAVRRYAWPVGGGAALVAAALVGWFAYQSAANLPGERVPSLGNTHIQMLGQPHAPYNSDPPTSGPHLPYIAPWGIHTASIPKELQVHNLEDGGVLVQYNCPPGCPDLVEKLAAIVRRYEKQVILAPYPGMDKRIALTAWGRIDKFDELDEKRIARFITAYKGIDHHPR